MELQSGLIVTSRCVDILGVVVQRDERRVGDENVSKVFETPSKIVSSGIKILDSVIEDLSKECDKRR